MRLAFPDVPWIFVYRNPVEVMVSNLRAASPLVTRGILGPDFLNFDVSLVAGMEDDEYAARVLGTIAETAARQVTGARGKLVEYRQLPEVVWGDLRRHFEMELTPDDMERLKQAAGLDAKHPTRRFESDTEAKQREAGGRMRMLAERWIAPHYAKLEEIRRQQAHGFATFRRLVLDNPALLERLGGLAREDFMEAALGMASEAGIPLQRYDVERALAEARAQRQQRLL